MDEQQKVYNLIKGFYEADGFGPPDFVTSSDGVIALTWECKRSDGAQMTKVSIEKDGKATFSNVTVCNHGFTKEAHFQNLRSALRIKFA